ncbi:hypothetical protein AX17_007045 [Amanita inopinata Kibby_2008]|nr:hypothetical protein AX17_007045 [Amanita inopinata Kibby_2008]
MNTQSQAESTQGEMEMDSLPLDTSHPAVRDYMALVRLQVLTPLSLLMNIAIVCICAIVTKPTIGEAIRRKPTALSPYPPILELYVAVLFLGQIGYCVMLVIASKRETKRALTRGVGMTLVVANWAMALWAISWVMEWWFFASVLQGVILLLLLYSNLALYIYHSATLKRPLDTAFIHAPVRFFVALTLLVLFPYCLFVALGLTHEPTAPGPPVEYSSWHAWTAFGIILGTNLFALLLVITQHDIVWCTAATWICVSMWSQRPKPVPVYVTTIAFTALHPIALLLTLAYRYYRRPSAGEGRIALPPGDEHPGLHRNRHAERPGTTTQEAASPPTSTTGPREIETGVWG